VKILIIGAGGREHALAWKIAQSPRVTELYCAPGNPGIASLAKCINIAPDDISSLADFALTTHIELTIVGPELPLAHGIVDYFVAAGLSIFGPTKAGAQLESSKLFAKQLMREANIPTAPFSVFRDSARALDHIENSSLPYVIKADGLAAGKGVFVCHTIDAARDAIQRIMIQREFGDSGDSVIIEDFLQGEEASFICLTDGTTCLALPSSQDHKAIFDNDRGPNTGGMGAYSPAPVITPDVHKSVMNTVMYPLLRALRSHGITYKGFLYAGLILQNGIPRVLEFNVRLGDPEAQPILCRIADDLLIPILASLDGCLIDVPLHCDPRSAVCVVMASGGYPGTYHTGYTIHGLHEAERCKDTFIFHAGTACHNNNIITNGGRVLGVTALGLNITESIERAYAAVDRIHWTDLHFRKDIARKAVAR